MNSERSSVSAADAARTAADAARVSAADAARTAADAARVSAAGAARSGNDRLHSQSGTDRGLLDAAEADRYALAFRPSWAPLAPELQPAAADARNEGAVTVTREAQEPLRVPGRSVRRRSGLLAGASIVSFLGLVYWGVSSTTHPTAPGQVSKPAMPAPTAAVETAAAEPAASTTTDLSALRARPDPAFEPSRARLAEEPAAENQVAPVEALAAASEATAAALTAQAPAEPAAAPDTAAPSGPAEAANAKAAEPSGTAAAPQPNASAAQVQATAPQLSAAAPQAVALPAAAPAPQARPASAAQPVAPVATAAPSHTPAPQPPATAVAPAATRTAQAIAAAAQPARNAVPQSPIEIPSPARLAAAPATHPEPIATAAHSPQALTEAAPQHKHLPLLSVRALPEGAILLLDGQRLPNPFDMRLPEGGKHKLEARFEGYETSSQTVRIEADARLTITLRRTAPAFEPQLQVRPLGQQQQPAQRPHGAGFVTSNPY